MYDLCIIGYGISGICTSKHALDNKLNYIILEKESNLGGCWYNKAFNWSKIQTHKNFYRFPNFKYNCENEYPNKNELLNYFNAYVKINNLDKNILYNSTVLNTEYYDNYWAITFSINNKIKIIKSKFIAVCSGLFNEKYIPKINNIGQFKGDIYHSSELNKKNFSIFNNKKVLVIGNGASSSDIIYGLVNNRKCNNPVYILYKSNKWYVKRYIFGISISIIINNFVLKLAKYSNNYLYVLIFVFISRFIFQNKLNLPNEKINYKNLIADDNIINFIKQKKCFYIKNSQELKSNFFNNFDSLIFCTGFKKKCSFINKNLNFNFYNHIIDPELKNCGFIGFCPSYNWIEVSYYQSLWFVKNIKNKIIIPKKTDMYKQINIIKKQSYKFNLEYNDLTYDSFNYINKLKKIEKI